MQFKELINQVLIRLREDTITVNWSGSINDSNEITPYQKLIASLVNDSKHSVESKHDWIALRGDTWLTTVAGTNVYKTAQSENTRFLDFINTTTGARLKQVSRTTINDERTPDSSYNLAVGKAGPSGEPTEYAVRGTEVNSGKMKIDLNPTPDKAYSLRLTNIKPQVVLTLWDDYLKVPQQPVMLGAWARAISERGEDGGTQSSVVAAETLDALNQAIILDHGNTEFESDWYYV